MAIVDLEVHDGDSEEHRICRLYWQCDEDGEFGLSVAAIAEQCEVTQADVASIKSRCCTARLTSTACFRCGERLVVKNRTEMRKYLGKPPEYCATCVAEQKADEAQGRADAAHSRKEQIAEEFEVVDTAPLDLSEIETAVLIGLASYLRTDEAKDGVVGPLHLRSDVLARGAEEPLKIVKLLFAKGLIRVHPSSPPEAFVWDEENLLTNEYYPTHACFFVVGTGDLSDRVERVLRDVPGVLNARRADVREELFELWLDASARECEAYLQFHLDDRGLTFNPGQKTRAVIREGLRSLNLGQMFNLIWRSAAKAADTRTRNGISSRHAANTAISILETQLDKARANPDDLKSYNLDSRVGISTFARTVCRDGLGLENLTSDHPGMRADTLPHPIRWQDLSAEDFERLVFSVVQQAEGYSEVSWLMHTNAPDHGRDIAAYRSRVDELSGLIRERVLIQCKHSLSRSINDRDLGSELTAISHWEPPPVDVFIVVTSGKFTSAAVGYNDGRRVRGDRPRIELWNDAHLETLLAKLPAVRALFDV